MSQPLQKNISLYRGDSTSYDFTISDIDPLDYDSISIRIAANRSTDGKTVINKQILSSDTGNNWALSKVRVNLTPAESQTIQVDRSTILSYDIEVTRTLGLVATVITEWAGEIVITEDVTIGNVVITPDTELDIYSNLASNDGTLGASLVGVSTTIWSTILSLGNRSVQKALEWLLNNKLNIPGSHTVNRLIKLGTATPSTEITGITVTSNDDITGARFVTGSDAPTDPSHLTRKDYVDGIPEDFLDSLGGSTGQVLTKTISGYDMETPPSADVEGYLDSLGGSVGDVLTKDPSGYIFDAPGGVEAYLDSLGGSNGQFLAKDPGGYIFDDPTQQPLADGSASSPSLNFASDTNTGIYRVGADQIGISSGGAKVGEFNSNGYMGLDNYLCVRDEKSTTTEGGTFTSGAWRTRDIQTVDVNRIDGSTVSSNQITLPEGRYKIKSQSPGYGVNLHKTRLRDITNSSTVKIGSTSISSDAEAYDTLSIIIGEFVLVGSATLEIQHQCVITGAINGFGRAAGFSEVEIYTIVEIWRIS